MATPSFIIELFDFCIDKPQNEILLKVEALIRLFFNGIHWMIIFFSVEEKCVPTLKEHDGTQYLVHIQWALGKGKFKLFRQRRELVFLLSFCLRFSKQSSAVLWHWRVKRRCLNGLQTCTLSRQKYMHGWMGQPQRAAPLAAQHGRLWQNKLPM